MNVREWIPRGREVSMWEGCESKCLQVGDSGIIGECERLGLCKVCESVCSYVCVLWKHWICDRKTREWSACQRWPRELGGAPVMV